MSASDRNPTSVEVRVDPDTWAGEVQRLRKGSPSRVAAERERRRLQQNGVPRAALLGCAAAGKDGTRLRGELKVYVPISDAPASDRPFAFVFSLAVDDGRPYLALTAFGERHPGRGIRSVYERAHKRLHGRYPDQERAQSQAAGLSPKLRSPSRAVERPRDQGGLER